MSVLGLNSKDRKYTKDKANISNSKVNRGCAQLTANRTSVDCVQISLRPSIPYIPLRVYHTGGFKAMNQEMKFSPDLILLLELNFFIFQQIFISSKNGRQWSSNSSSSVNYVTNNAYVITHHSYAKTGIGYISLWQKENIRIKILKYLWHGLLCFITFGSRGRRARSARRPRGQNVATIALERRFLGTIIAVFKMWLCPFNQPCIRHPKTKLK